MKLTINLYGGLGGQLLSLYAGLALAIENGLKEVRIDSTEILGGTQPILEGTGHEWRAPGESPSVTLMGALQDCSVSLSDKNFVLIWEEGRRKVNFEYNIYRLQMRLRIPYYITRQFRSLYHGFNPTLLSLRHSVSIFGGFRTYKYKQMIEESGLSVNVSPKIASKWYKQLEREISTTSSIGIHLRGTDFALAEDTKGILSFEYYDNALVKFLQEGYINEKIDVYLFSDDLSVAKKFSEHIKRHTELVVRVINPKDSTHAIESILLLSKCQKIICANSAFSYCSALLSGHNNVLQPKPYMKNDPEFNGGEWNELIPDNWQTCDSIWQSVEQT